MSYSEPLAASAAAMTQQLDEGLCAELLPILSEPEALIVAELLERIAADETSELKYIAQLVIVRIYDRLETSRSRPSPAPAARGTAPELKAARTLTTLFGLARRRAC